VEDEEQEFGDEADHGAAYPLRSTLDQNGRMQRVGSDPLNVPRPSTDFLSIARDLRAMRPLSAGGGTEPRA
jgi:hypothetical protein